MECAGEGCGGLGIRIRVPGAWNNELAERTRALLARVDPDVPVDLLLDLHTVLPIHPDAAKEALRAFDMLVPLAVWRTGAKGTGNAGTWNTMGNNPAHDLCGPLLVPVG
ncbi:hypothetical protein [Streptomyces sp. NPDC003480]